MLDDLQHLADILSTDSQPVSFGYGTSAELNVLADSTGTLFDADSGFLLFHEGYFQATPRILPNASFQHTHALNILFLCRSALSDKPEQKKESLSRLYALYARAFLSLDKMGEISNAVATMNLVINRTDCNLDGIRLSCQLKTPAVPIC